MRGELSFVAMSDVHREKIRTSKRRHYGIATDGPLIDAAFDREFPKWRGENMK